MKDVVVAIGLWLLASVAFAQTFTSTAGGPIPDGAGVGPNNYGAPLDVPILVSGVAQGTIDTVSVAFNANHTWVGDLEVTLISPYGQENLLFARTGATDANGGSAANLVAANAHTFSDTALNNWWTVAGTADVTIPASTARTVVSGGPGVSNPPPVTSILSAFQRRPPNGTWRLRFRDGWGGDSGNVVSASITLTTTGVTRTVTKIDDSNDGVCDADCSLREAITASSDGAASVDRIEFARPYFATPRRIVVGSNLDFMTKAFALVGPGAPLLNLSGAGLHSVNVGGVGGSRKRHLSGLRVTDFTLVQILGSTRLHGMEFAFLTGRIDLDDAEMTDSSIHSNRFSGGSILRLSSSSILRRVTVSGNVVNASGNFASTISPQNDLTLIDCSIVGNQVAGSSAVGGVISADGVVRVQNSVIAGNRATGSTPLGNDIAPIPGSSGSFQSLGHNLIGDVGSVAVFNQAGDQAGTGAAPLDPVLSPLSRHGGTIPVQVPLPGSPLLDRGKRVGADARGVPLVDLSDVTPATGGNNGDIGAVELSPGLVSNLNDSGAGSLRQALLDAPAAPAITDILFSLNLPPAARITLTSGQLSIDRNVSIHGPGAQKLSISGNRQSRVVAVLPNRRVSISGLTLIDGNGVGAPNDQEGGIVLGAEESQLSIVDSVLRNGVAALGVGGVFVLPNAYGELIGSTATDMFANAVVSLDAGSALLIHRSTISGCALNCLADNADSEASLIDSTLSGAENTVVTWAGRLLLRNSLLAGRADFADGASSVISAGHNLVGATASTAFNGAGDQVGTLAAPIDARLSPLAQHGGPVPTQVPLAGSPA